VIGRIPRIPGFIPLLLLKFDTKLKDILKDVIDWGLGISTLVVDCADPYLVESILEGIFFTDRGTLDKGLMFKLSPYGQYSVEEKQRNFL
jgi:hypothetical protein